MAVEPEGSRRCGGAPQISCWLGLCGPHFVELNDRFQSSFQGSSTPWTVDPSSSALSDQTSGIAAASLTIILSAWANALNRADWFAIAAAESIFLLTFGSLSTPQFELLIGTIASPLNGTNSA